MQSKKFEWFLAILAVLGALLALHYRSLSAAALESKEIPVIVCWDANNNGWCEKSEYPLSGITVSAVPSAIPMPGIPGESTCTTDNSGKCKLIVDPTLTYNVTALDYTVKNVPAGNLAVLAIPPHLMFLPLGFK